MKPILKISIMVSGLLVLAGVTISLFRRVSEEQGDVLPIVQAMQSPIETPSSPEGQFTFGSPEVILTNTAAIGLAAWSPDSTKMLVTLRQTNSVTETIEVFDPLHLNLRSCGQRRSIDSRPIWANNAEKVAYLAFSGQQHELWISNCDETSQQQPAMHGLGDALTGYGQQVLTVDLSQKRATLVDSFGRPLVAPLVDLQAMGFDVSNARFSPKMEWSPSGDKVAIFDGKQLAVLDLPTRKVHPVEIDKVDRNGHADSMYRVLHASWSPDSRHIALIATFGDLAVNFSDLLILNVDKGEITTVHPPSLAEGGMHYVTNISWAADSHHVAALFKIERDNQGFAYDGLFLVDSMTGSYQRILPDYKFGAGKWGWGLAWDPTGKQLLVNCPTRFEGRTCLIAVNPYN